jgi:hypothetical protein
MIAVGFGKNRRRFSFRRQAARKVRGTLLMSLTAPESNPLRLTSCMLCGYSLETLPIVGVCPECGCLYDQDTVVLHGYSSGQGDVSTASPGIVAVSVFVAAIYIFRAWTEVRKGNAFEGVVIAVFLATSLAIALAWRHMAHKANSGHGPLQCRFNSFGCLQCDLPEETIGSSDLRWLWSLVRIGLVLTFLGAAFFSGAGARNTSYILAVFVGAWAGMTLIRRTIRRAKARGNAASQVLMASARNSGWQVIATPWSEIASIRIGHYPAKPTRWYLTVDRRRSWLESQPINAEVEATAGQIAELRVRMAQWQPQAKLMPPMRRRVATGAE